MKGIYLEKSRSEIKSSQVTSNSMMKSSIFLLKLGIREDAHHYHFYPHNTGRPSQSNKSKYKMSHLKWKGTG
jgi:hypothetical protein